MSDVKITTIAGEFDHGHYLKLKNLHDTAVRKRNAQFTFDGEMMLTSFANYLLEFLEPYFKPTNNNQQ